jgi:hypothetical protein
VKWGRLQPRFTFSGLEINQQIAAEADPIAALKVKRMFGLS